MLYFAIVVYAIAMTAANLTIATFGPWVSPINAFFLIGLDLALRDWLHVRLKVWQMGALIASTGALTFMLNPTAGHIAVASAVAFTAAALVDWITFIRLRGAWLIGSLSSASSAICIVSLLISVPPSQYRLVCVCRAARSICAHRRYL